SDWVHWSCYSLAGVLTSDQPAAPQMGYGTLSEASWGPRHRLTGAPLRTGSGTLAMTRLRDRLLLVFGPADSATGPYAPINSLFMAQGGF
ncbi:MAG: hypothetical protein KC457_35335, partial [Myxococcales bacterium]|nr:hypothetical protein [Myxococcales bacterium]